MLAGVPSEEGSLAAAQERAGDQNAAIVPLPRLGIGKNNPFENGSDSLDLDDASGVFQGHETRTRSATIKLFFYRSERVFPMERMTSGYLTRKRLTRIG